MDGLSASGLADLAGVGEAEAARLVELGLLVARDASDPFLGSDVPKVRLAVACERAGLPMEGIVSAIRAGRLAFAVLEATPFRRGAGLARGRARPEGGPGTPRPPRTPPPGGWGGGVPPAPAPGSRCARTSWR